MKNMQFDTKLTATLALTFSSGEVVIPAGEWVSFCWELHPWGFEAEVVFRVASGGNKHDKVFTDFIKPDLIIAELKVAAVTTKPTPEPEPVPLKGPVVFRGLEEEVSTEIKEAPVLVRTYRIGFTDPLAFYWTRHRPTRIYAKKSLTAVVEENTPAGVTVKTELAAFDEVLPLITVGLGTPDNLTHQAYPAHFFDWVVTRLRHVQGHLLFDPVASSYTLAAVKPADGDPTTLKEGDTGTASVTFPEPPRHGVSLINGVSKDARVEPVSNENAATGIMEEILIMEPVPKNVTTRKTLETSRLTPESMRVSLPFARFPETRLLCGSLVSLPSPEKTTKLITCKKVYRITAMSATAQAPAPQTDAGTGCDQAFFSACLQVSLEAKEDTASRLPDARPVPALFHVEGVIASDVGEESEATYQVVRDTETAGDRYRVTLPAFDDLEIPALFAPDNLPSHLFFPLYKGTRALLALSLCSARIKGTVDWLGSTRVDQKAQSQRILFGKDEKSQVRLEHRYEEGKPVFEMERVMEKDGERLTMEEGKMTWQVGES
ncbi:consensus disorder prediction [Desulfoluna spongiiphila]|nr:consensus disorder prediction [Desulfoluna spongiiphila]